MTLRKELDRLGYRGTRIADIAQEINIKINTLHVRYARGMRGSDLIRTRLHAETSEDLLKLAEESGLPYRVVYERHRRGDRGKALTRPFRERRSTKLGISELVRETGIPYNTLYSRYKAGKRGEELTKKVSRKRLEK